MCLTLCQRSLVRCVSVGKQARDSAREINRPMQQKVQMLVFGSSSRGQGPSCHILP
jgi:hypothetical protein